MADHVDQGEEQLDLGRSLRADDSLERVDSLWRQVMVYKAFADSDLSEAKARRAEAEKARETAEQEAADATRLLCEGLREDAEGKLREAESVRSEATAILRQAEAESGRARNVIREAEETRERLVSEGKQKALEILEQARLAARQESTELRQQALQEIKGILGRVESIRMATDEELETQRIFANIAKLKATSGLALTEPTLEVDGGIPEEEKPSPDRAPEISPEPAASVDSPANTDAVPTSIATNGTMPIEKGAKAEGPTNKSAKGKGKKAGKP